MRPPYARPVTISSMSRSAATTAALQEATRPTGRASCRPSTTSDYDGPLVIESFTADNASIATAASIWRPLAPTQDDLATTGLRNLRSLSNGESR